MNAYLTSTNASKSKSIYAMYIFFNTIENKINWKHLLFSILDNVEALRGTKRRITNDEDDDIERLMHTPKKKRLKTTSRYIYETLFLEGRESDIIVSALNREWKLHKLYLGQSAYFASMFNGNWKESTMDHIRITIVGMYIPTLYSRVQSLHNPLNFTADCEGQGWIFLPLVFLQST